LKFYTLFIVLLLVLAIFPNDTNASINSSRNNYLHESPLNHQNDLLNNFAQNFKNNLAYRSPLNFQINNISLLNISDSNNTTQSPYYKRVIDDITYAGKVFVDDWVYIYSSPTRITKKSLIQLTAIFAVGGMIYAYDDEILDMLDRNQDMPWYRPIRDVGESMEKWGLKAVTLKYYFAGLGVGYIFGIDALTLASADIFNVLFVTTVGQGLTKKVFGRERPNAGNGKWSFEPGKGESFISGHTNNVFLVSTVLAYHVNYKPFTYSVFGLASIVGLQRMTSKKHYASDVYFGALYGYSVASAIMKRRDYLKIAPVTYLESGGAGLSLMINF
jgi:membrane-associated phospholipid phosphatase